MKLLTVILLLAGTLVFGQQVNVTFNIPYIEYLEASISPADINGIVKVKNQNKASVTNLVYNKGTMVTFDKIYMVSNSRDLRFKAIDKNGNTVSGRPITIEAYDGLIVNAEFYATTDTLPVGNIAYGKTAVASSVKALSTNVAAYAIDANVNTRWESNNTDNEWIYVDLGVIYPIKRITLNWETASGKDFILQTSNDLLTWNDLYHETAGVGGKAVYLVNGVGRYVRMLGKVRNTPYSYSLFEFQIEARLPDPVPPVANAGGDIEMTLPTNQVSFKGDSSDADGYVKTILWSQISGPNTATLTGTTSMTPSASGLVAGVYVFKLTLTDNDGLSDESLINVTVLPKPLFDLLTPLNHAMITDTRTPKLSWGALGSAVKYEVYLNITKKYNWYESGNLLDKYTLMTTVTSTNYTLETDLSDRWTYKWYVVAYDASGNSYNSSINTFSVYLPYIETVDDGIAIVNGCRDLNKNGTIEPYENWKLTVDERVDDLLSRMTPEEKAFQLYYNIQEYALAGWGFGPFLPQDGIDFQKKSAATRLGIPYVEAGDCIHGYQTSYPTQSCMAAARNPDMVNEVADIQRREEIAIGFRGTLAPSAEVGTMVLYPRIQEGNGEDANFAAAQVRAMICGLQGGPELNPNSLLVHVKHWPGEGAGGESGIVYDEVSIKYHMKPWKAVVEANASGVMPGYAGANFLDPSGKGAGDSKPIIDYLRNVIGFKGLICTDWLPSGVWINACNAGSDVMGGANPTSFAPIDFYNGVGQTRIDEAVRQVLRVKFKLGIFEDPYKSGTTGTSTWFTKESYNKVIDAARQGITLLKNNNVLPIKLKAGDEILMAGPRANDGTSYCIWTSFFHDNWGAKTMYQAVKNRALLNGITVALDSSAKPAYAIAVVGEASYTHGTIWPKTQLTLSVDQQAILQNIKNKGIPLVVVYIMPRPYIIEWCEANADAIIVAYRPGDGGGEALAQILFGDYAPKGKLPWQLPRSGQVGTDQALGALESWDIPFDLGATVAERNMIRWYISNGDSVPPTFGNPLYPYGAGIQGYGLTDGTNPTAFSLSSPASGASIVDKLPLLQWTASTDPESGIQGYDVYLDNVKIGTTKNNFYQIDTLKTNGIHNWYVVAKNWANGETESTTRRDFTFNDKSAPTAFNLVLPLNNSVINDSKVDLYWTSSNDAGTGLDHYSILLNGIEVKKISKSDLAFATGNIALGGIATASSNSGTDQDASKAIDSSMTTRWASKETDNEWLMVDLNKVYNINTVKISWETACANSYNLEGSIDGTNFTTFYVKTGSLGGVETIPVTNTMVRYIRLKCIQRKTTYGYSVYEFEVYGDPIVDNLVTNLSNGNYAWNVKAYDMVGNSLSTSIWNFTVTGSDVANILPITSITSPVSGASFLTNNLVTIQASAVDVDGSITKTELYIDGILSGTDTQSPYKWSVPMGAGVHSLIVKATDNKGGFRESKVVSVTVVANTTGITEVKESEISVYPNPFSESFNFHSDVSVGLELFDVNGQLLKVLNNVSGDVQLGMGLEDGVYFLKVVGGNRVFKVVKVGR